ncbi:conserved unknown protein [Ectocarpus siliculosus]|uniref:Uncharacterized protein n=1 Tax=Ectocarpus siliculosus TaxID=2880 RepID=D7FUL9_ECTSI|nr:conserved unknown protein [Ectocarpus siliculosus]|eukprot:CBJ31675.1 conserved unknown protein [Ectocarpus siliculosus]
MEAAGVAEQLAGLEIHEAESGAAPTGSRFLDVAIVVLNQACGDGGQKHWFASTKELQLASLQLCEACRDAAALHLRVDTSTPLRLFAPADSPSDDSEEDTRVPRLRAREQLTFGRRFNRPLEAVSFPASLREITFGWGFNRAIEAVSWPAELRRLTFGWMPNLEELTLLLKASERYDILVDIEWPAGLKRLNVKHRVRLEGDEMPAGLQVIHV